MGSKNSSGVPLKTKITGISQISLNMINTDAEQTFRCPTSSCHEISADRKLKSSIFACELALYYTSNLLLLKNFKQVKKLMESFIEMKDKVDPLLMGSMYKLYGLALLQTDNLKEAEDAFLEADSIFKVAGTHHGSAIIQLILGYLRYEHTNFYVEKEKRSED
jgi:hypothetical protein